MDGISRRQALALLAAAAALLGLPDEALAGDDPPPVAAFDADDTRILRLVLDAIFGPGAERTDAVAALGVTLGYLDEERQALIVQLPGLLDQLSRVLVPTGVAWSALDAEGRARALVDWERSPLGFRRQVFQALRQLLLFAAHTDPSTWPMVGYPGPWLGRVALPVHPPRFGEP